MHNGPVVGSIFEASAVYQIEGQPASVLQVGDVFFEPEGERIARFDAGDDGVTFFAYFLLSPARIRRSPFLACSRAPVSSVGFS